MFELALKLLAALSLEGFKGEVSIVTDANKAAIHITPPLNDLQLKQIPENVKEHCKVIVDDHTSILMLAL